MSHPSASQPPPRLPNDVGHRHSDVSGGWLRAATFGAMDGLVSNTGLIAGGLAARFTRKPVWWAASRQLLLGAAAIGATYLVGRLIAAVV